MLKEQPKKKVAFVNFYGGLSLVALLLLAFLVYWFYFNVYSDGERTGLLTKLSRKGNIFKTHEGEVLIGNFQQMMATNELVFSPS